MDRPAPDLTKVFVCGQSVVVKVVEVKEDKGRFLCSLRMVDCYHDDPAVGRGDAGNLPEGEGSVPGLCAQY